MKHNRLNNFFYNIRISPILNRLNALIIILIVITSPFITVFSNSYYDPSNYSMFKYSLDSKILSSDNYNNRVLKRDKIKNSMIIDLAYIPPPDKIKNDFIKYNTLGWELSKIPAAPQLPVKHYTLLLPPATDVNSIVSQLVSDDAIVLDNPYYFSPAPSPFTIVNGKLYYSISPAQETKYYNHNDYWPLSPIQSVKVSKLRSATILDFDYYPYQFNPVNHSTLYRKHAKLEIKWKNTSQRYLKDPLTLSFLNDWQGLLQNYDDIYPYYKNILKDESQNIKFATNSVDSLPTYLIITANNTVGNSTVLSDFVSYKEHLGFRVKIITENDYGTATGKQRAINIRNWLKNHYVTDKIEYVLLIGDPDPDDE